MVWTVNGEREIRYWLRRPIDVLVTDRPPSRSRCVTKRCDQGISPAGMR
jgi:hypothetical protein